MSFFGVINESGRPCRGVKKTCQWHVFSRPPQQPHCEKGNNCLRRPYSFRVAEKNMERKVHQRGGEESPLFGNTPRCRARKSFAPHNQSLNLSVHTSFSAQDAAAPWHLFGAPGIVPRAVFAGRNVVIPPYGWCVGQYHEERI